jgi:hypothetical protein
MSGWNCKLIVVKPERRGGYIGTLDRQAMLERSHTTSARA